MPYCILGIFALKYSEKVVIITEDYKSLYFSLFAAVADATEALEQGNSELAKTILIEAQRTAEEGYISMIEGKGHE